MGEPKAVIECLSASYGGSKVLTDISFKLAEDDCLAIVGPVGSGKTTLAKALSGRLFRTGSVYFKSRSNRNWRCKPKISLFYKTCIFAIFGTFWIKTQILTSSLLQKTRQKLSKNRINQFFMNYSSY